MSIQAVAWVLENSEAVGYDRLVLLAIANHADAGDGRAWPSVARIASEARVDPATVYRAVHRLVALDELEVDRGGGRGRTNTYVLKQLPAATVKSRETVAAGNKTVAASTKNGRSSARQTISNHHEPKGGVVITHCFNCGQDPTRCLCEVSHAN